MHTDDVLFGQIRNRVLTLSGNNASIRVDGGCLVICDGPAKGGAMTTLRLPRAGFPIDRIVATKPNGNVSLAALKWLYDIGTGFTMLDWDGAVIFASAPRSIDLPAIRRAQISATADNNALGTAIMRELLRVKIAGQGEVLKLLDARITLPTVAGTRTAMLQTEATAATSYWNAWKDLPIRFSRGSVAPDHWQRFGSRQSPLSKSARKAITPANALLNYLYGVAAVEQTIALTAVGLDASFAVFHNDRENRTSLTFDAIETIRPSIDAFLLYLLQSTTFEKKDFYELGDGTIRITHPLNSHLALTSSLWRKPAEKVAIWLVNCFKTGKVRPLDISNPHMAQQRIVPKCCVECGRALSGRQERFCSKECQFANNVAVTGSATPGFAAYRQHSPDISRTDTANAKRRIAHNRMAAARDEWNRRICSTAIPSPSQLAELRG